jgi:hypothetical protein
MMSLRQDKEVSDTSFYTYLPQLFVKLMGPPAGTMASAHLLSFEQLHW